MSSVFIEEPLITGDIGPLSLKSVFLWGMSVFFSAAKMNFNPNVAGITLSFSLIDITLISISTWMLCRGFRKKIFIWAIPWMAITVYSTYFIHYQELFKITSSLKIRRMSVLQWMALFTCTTALVFRASLLVKVAQVFTNLWVKKKMEETR